MFDVANKKSTEQERVILRKLRVWIAALAAACLLAGIGIGAMLSGRPTVAQGEVQIARAPEALSASFAEIARRVEPAVVNIETLQAASDLELSDKDNEDKDDSATVSVGQLLDQLPERYRQAVVLFYMEDKSYEQTAASLGLPLGTVKALLHRARKRLIELTREAA